MKKIKFYIKKNPIIFSIILLNISLYFFFRILPIGFLPNFEISKLTLSHPLSIILSSFSHGDIIHLSVTMILLWMFFDDFQRFYNKKDQLVILLSSSIPIGILTYIYVIVFQPNISVVGYSGVCMAVLASFIRFMDSDYQKLVLAQLIIIHLIFIAMDSNIAWFTHLFGFLIGFSYSYKRIIISKFRSLCNNEGSVSKKEKDKINQRMKKIKLKS
jgi:rhomboid protease GluP